MGAQPEFARVLGNALTGRPCRTFSSDVRSRVEATNTSTYPDLSVVCGRLEKSSSDPDAITNPVVLVSQEEKRIEVQRLNAQGLWELRFFASGEQVELASVGVLFAVDAVYANPLAQ